MAHIACTHKLFLSSSTYPLIYPLTNFLKNWKIKRNKISQAKIEAKIRSLPILSWKLFFHLAAFVLSVRSPLHSFLFSAIHMYTYFALSFCIYVQSAVITMRFDCIAHGNKPHFGFSRFFVCVFCFVPLTRVRNCLVFVVCYCIYHFSSVHVFVAGTLFFWLCSFFWFGIVLVRWFYLHKISSNLSHCIQISLYLIAMQTKREREKNVHSMHNFEQTDKAFTFTCFYHPLSFI